MPTTGGTDFDCVAEHALDRRLRRLLLPTDGDADLDGELARRLRESRTGLYLVLTKENPACPLLPLAARHWVLDE